MTDINDSSLQAKKGAVYLFLDEGGDLNFAPSGTRHFTMTCVTTFRPFVLDQELTELRYDFIESSLDIEYFHASEDKQAIRDRVFATLSARLSSYRVDCIIAEKRKAAPSLRTEVRFYPLILGWLLSYVVKGIMMKFPNLTDYIIITDQLPIKRKRDAVEKAIKRILAEKLPEEIKYKILHHDSKSCPGLQIADYLNWAIFRKWERNDLRSFSVVSAGIESEFDIFKSGKKFWY